MGLLLGVVLFGWFGPHVIVPGVLISIALCAAVAWWKYDRKGAP
jgi:hypothetical protein